MGTVSRKRVIVNGMVQGVGFRYYTEAQAGALGLGGYVRNRSDGAVEAEIEGDDDAHRADAGLAAHRTAARRTWSRCR